MVSVTAKMSMPAAVAKEAGDAAKAESGRGGSEAPHSEAPRSLAHLLGYVCFST